MNKSFNIHTETKTGYKKTAIGWIPEGWGLKKLGNLISHTKGFAFKSSDFNSEKGRRIIKVSDTDFDKINDDDPTFITEEKAKEYQKYTLKQNDIIFTTVGSRPPVFDSLVGKAIQVTNEYEGALLNQNNVLVRVKDKNNVLQNFLYPHFRTNRYIYFITTIIRGNANQGSITLKDLFNYRIPLPPLPEQKKIAEILSTWDHAIETLEQLIEIKEELKRGLMQELLTGNTGFEGEWETKPIKSFSKVITGSTPSTSEPKYYDGDYLFVSPSDMNETKYVTKTEKTLTKEGFELGRLVSKGSTLFVAIGSTIGKTAVAGIDLTTNQQIHAIATDEEICLNEFFFYQLTRISDRIKLLAGKQAVPILNKSNFESLRISFPPIQEQKKIVTLLAGIENEIETLKKNQESISYQKKGLMQQLLTGKTRVQA
ncbi:MAG: restriction endonuclease subunit S [Candidatus Paceibacterota bacterium]